MSSMTDRRVLIIRRWLVLVGVALLGLYDPVFWFGALAIIPCPECCDDQCVVTCPRCLNSEGPCTFQVVISGFTNLSCSTCADLDGTYLLANYVNAPPVCRWSTGDVLNICSTWTSVVLQINRVITDNKRSWLVQYNLAGATPRFTMQQAANTDGTSCFEDNVNNLSIPFSSNDVDGKCDGSSATCLVTALTT